MTGLGKRPRTQTAYHLRCTLYCKEQGLRLMWVNQRAIQSADVGNFSERTASTWLRWGNCVLISFHPQALLSSGPWFLDQISCAGQTTVAVGFSVPQSSSLSEYSRSGRVIICHSTEEQWADLLLGPWNEATSVQLCVWGIQLGLLPSINLKLGAGAGWQQQPCCTDI